MLLSTFQVMAQDLACTSKDQRGAIEQLDCFCNPKGPSTIQIQIQEVTGYAQIFGLDKESSCTSISATVMLAHQDSNGTLLKNRLTAIGYSGDAAQSIVSDAKAKAEIAKRMFGALQMTGLVIRLNINGILVTNALPENLFKNVEQLKEIAKKFPEERVMSCAEVTTDLDKINTCLVAPADIKKIRACVDIKMLSSDTMKCLYTVADVPQTKACVELNMLSSDTLKCLSEKHSVETIRSCKQLNMLSSDTLKCISEAAPTDIIAACKNLNMLSSDTNKCMKSGVSAEKIAACGRLNLLASDTLSCINSGASVDVIGACGAASMLGSDTVACLRSGESTEKIRKCTEENSIGSSIVRCIRR